MTRIEELSALPDAELERMLAEIAYGECEPCKKNGYTGTYRRPDGQGCFMAPRTCSDRNAVAPIEDALTEDQFDTYLAHVKIVMELDDPGNPVLRLNSAKPRQRTIALIATLETLNTK